MNARGTTRLVLAIWLTLGLVASHAQDGAMVTHKVRGVLTAVAPPERRIVVASPKLAKPLVLTWDENTRVYEGSRVVPSSILVQGQAVEITYVLPTFGNDHARRIVLIPVPGGSKETSAKR